MSTKLPVDRVFAHDGYRVVAEPFLSARGLVNAVRVCAVEHPSELPTEDGLPERLPTGAWVWDLTRSVIMPSPQLYDLYRVPEESRKYEMPTVEWLSEYARAIRPPERAFMVSVTGADGDTLLDVLPVFCADGALRDVRTAMRVESAGDQRWLHGITCDVTDGDVAEMPAMSFAENVLRASLADERDVFTVVMDLRTVRPVVWLSEPPGGVQWRPAGDPARDPAVHPEDISTVKSMVEQIFNAPVHGRIRVRGTDGQWLAVHCSAMLMSRLHEQGVSAAVVKFHLDGPEEAHPEAS